ncbi:DUF742 domain-containing protein [Kibdelosporangium philippinense]|uniref:DUF742 domain-containing protein n=1 Tax=Kibdelosporangium philippinense TaxID=211113 RepID=A0ABS8Z8K2_9PSEU|nr:DUF742 domain-containing protein [Kibdelosporangium philippinense]MCE7003842.1 DUF742 domain-containing protein [Kibdelosporangium philippinense]
MGDDGQLSGLFFGGWGDYQTWADHDFQLRSSVEKVPVRKEKAAQDQPPTQPHMEPVIPSWEDELLSEPAEEAEAEPRRLVRPYTRTGGRTRPVHSLELETLLSYSPGWQTDLNTLRADHRAICVACHTPQSTAELAVHLGLPLGAARVLIADVVELGLIHVHELELVDNRPSMDLLERVHQGLLRL